MTKKEYQEYRSRHSALKRWFFINASRFCKDKYSRGERKIVHHSKHVLLYSVSTILLYTILLGLSILFFLYMRGILADKVCDCAFLFYYCYFLLLFVLLYFIEGIRNKEYHKSRHR